MSYQQDVFSLIAKLGGSKHKIAIDRTLCQFMGGLEGGVFLSQLLYWSDKGNNEWFYKSHKEWYDEVFLSPYQVRQCIKACMERGFLETKVKKANGSPTLHYKLDPVVFMDSIMKFLSIDNEKFDYRKSNISDSIPQNLSMESEKLSELITKTTTKTTTKITSVVADATPTPQQEMFGAICEAIGWDYNTLSKDDKGQVAQAVGVLTKASYGVDDIRRFMMEVWFEDWRWKKENQHPTLKQLRQEIGKTRSMVKQAAPIKKQTGMDSYRQLAASQGIKI
jgi:hypothetical protein